MLKLDYYKILGLKPDASNDEIKRAYQMKLKKMHPDKIEQTKENKLKYKLVREAGDLLININERKAYDIERTMEQNYSENFEQQKNNFNKFLELQKCSTTEDDIKLARLEFEKEIQTKKIEPMDQDEFLRKIETLELQRDTQLNEINHNDIFKNKQYNDKIFNKIFEKEKKKLEKKNSDGIEVYNPENILAYNDFGNETEQPIYDVNFSTINNGFIGINCDDDDLRIDTPDLEDCKNKSELTQENIDNAYEKYMKFRNEQDNEFDKFLDNGSYKSALEDKYGISNSMGFMVGTDTNGNQKNYKHKYNEDIETIYKELTE